MDDTAAKQAPEGGDGKDAKAESDKQKTQVSSAVPERTEGQLNPSSPGNTGTTPGTNARNG